MMKSPCGSLCLSERQTKTSWVLNKAILSLSGYISLSQPGVVSCVMDPHLNIKHILSDLAWRLVDVVMTTLIVMGVTFSFSKRNTISDLY